MASSWLALIMAPGCNKLSDKECLILRTQAFEIINEAHTCNDDTDCFGSAWPECPRPLSKKNRERVAPMKAKFDEGDCKEPTHNCRETPEIYCKEGLCVYREQRGGENPVPP